MKHDLNKLETSAQRHIESGNDQNALRIYLFMADGDQSLDGGYLGKRIAQCHEALSELHAAKCWYGRAIEENPVVNADCVQARELRSENQLPLRDTLLAHVGSHSRLPKTDPFSFRDAASWSKRSVPAIISRSIPSSA